MRDIKKMDKLLLCLVILFCVLGLIMIFSSSSVSTLLRYHVSSSHFFTKQIEALIVGIIVGLFILKVPTSKYKVLSYLSVFVILALLFLVLVNGKITGGASSWLNVGPATIQPSEFAKVVLIVFMAVYYGSLSVKNNRKFFLYLVPMALAIIFATLTMMQPDLGGAFILIGIAGLTFISVPYISKNIGKVLKLGIGAVLLIVAFLYITKSSFLTSEQMSRLDFKNPCSRYTEDTGYQVCNGLIAIANGGLFGMGLGNSTQKYLYLPESHTDFIFPIICEELGSIVGSIVIIGYIIFLTRIFRIAKEADNLRTSILAYGTFWYFTMHITINLFGILAMIPLTGVPLPFLSYGGSFCLSSIVLVFIVERVSIENKKNRLTREMAKITN